MFRDAFCFAYIFKYIHMTSSNDIYIRSSDNISFHITINTQEPFFTLKQILLPGLISLNEFMNFEATNDI